MALRMVSSLRITATRARRAGLALGAQAAVEGFEGRVVLDRHQAGHVERGTHLDAAGADRAFALAAAAVAAERGEAGERGNLMALDAAQFGQFGQEGARDDVADPRRAGQQVELLAPQRALPDQFVDRPLDALGLGFQALPASFYGSAG